MYDILQLNDMLVPELLDIAEKLKIPNAKKLYKQDLFYKVLDKQAVSASDSKNAPSEDKGRARKRIVKATTANSTEEAVVESGDSHKEQRKEAPKKKGHDKSQDKSEKTHPHATQPKGKGNRKKGEDEEAQPEINFAQRHSRDRAPMDRKDIIV
jgi:transcription termination factor Rho